MTADNYVAHLARAAEAALGSMRRYAIAPSVDNYAVWFFHHAGYNPALSRMIAMLEESRDPFDQARQHELHQPFIEQGKQARAVEETVGRAGAALAAVMRNVDDLRRDTGGYGQTLDVAATDIAGVTRIDQLSRLVAALQRDTASIRARTDLLQAELVHRTEEVGALRFELQQAHQAVSMDALTGIGNRRLFDQAMRDAMIDAAEHGEPLSLLLLDIDHFKTFNDTHGHQLGDLVLRLLALKLKETVKGRDVPVRYGGEEFALILPQTPLAGALELAEQIRKDVATKRVQLKSSGQTLGEITLSIGAALYRADEPMTPFVERADQALYAAKRGGRNCVLAES